MNPSSPSAALLFNGWQLFWFLVHLCLTAFHRCVLVFQDKTREVRDLKSKMQALFDERESMTAETQELTKQRAKLELNIKDLRDEEAGDKTSKVNYIHACVVDCNVMSYLAENLADFELLNSL